MIHIGKILLLVFCIMTCRAYPSPVRINVTADMIIEGDAARAMMLFDEAVGDVLPPDTKAETQWHAGWKEEDYPSHITVDLQESKQLLAICLYDSNSSGNFIISYGKPGSWQQLISEDCGAYNTWKKHFVKIDTRYLRFKMVDPGARINEAAIYVNSPSQPEVKRDITESGTLFGKLPLVDEIICSSDTAHKYSEDPAGCSKIEKIRGIPFRTIPNIHDEGSYFAYRIGKGKHLQPGKAYLLTVDYPEDKPRSMMVLNRGCEAALGFHTGNTVGDGLHTQYVHSNPESLDIPLRGNIQKWQMFFHLHDRFVDLKLPRGEGPRSLTPEDGFDVIIAQFAKKQAPMSAGSAVYRIQLFEVPQPELFSMNIKMPPGQTPRRHIFWREEMSDGVIAASDGKNRGVMIDTDWYRYKAELMKFLGINTFCKDLLEFGHNQGWDCGTGWYNQSKFKNRWSDMLEMLKEYNFDVLPYYEYAGSIGPGGVGNKKRCVTLDGKKNYTHVEWTEKANADITDPDVLDDAKKLLQYTVVRHKDKVNFAGAWFRPRPSAIPISFSDSCLKLFENDTEIRDITRQKLKDDKDLLDKYYTWWFGKRKQFLLNLRDYMLNSGIDNPVVLYTTDTSEPGLTFNRFNAPMVAENIDPWKQIGEKVISFQQVIDDQMYKKALLSPRLTWGDWEWQHSCPRSDPENYDENVLMTYTFNRKYTVVQPENFDLFRNKSGLALVRHHCLNENMMNGKLGYFVCDFERAGPYSMMAEAMAFAYGDPEYIGYLASSSFNKGFPEYARRFYSAFLSLPAIKSTMVPVVGSGKNAVLRVFILSKTDRYVGIVNTSTRDNEVTVQLVPGSTITDAPTGQPVHNKNGKIKLRMYPYELRALHLKINE